MSKDKSAKDSARLKQLEIRLGLLEGGTYGEVPEWVSLTNRANEPSVGLGGVSYSGFWYHEDSYGNQSVARIVEGNLYVAFGSGGWRTACFGWDALHQIYGHMTSHGVPQALKMSFDGRSLSFGETLWLSSVIYESAHRLGVSSGSECRKISEVSSGNVSIRSFRDSLLNK